MRPDLRRVAAAVVPVGFLLGFLDFVWIKFVPFPLAQLGNSMAVWAVAAFFFGFWVRSGAVRAAVSASVMLVLAVPSYYLAAVLIQGDDWASIWAVSSFVWMAMGVVAGVVFGIGGTWSRTGVGWFRVVGTALPGAVFLAEAALHMGRILNPSYGAESAGDALVATVAGVVGIGVAGRSNRDRAVALGVAVPVALLGYAAFWVIGIR